MASSIYKTIEEKGFDNGVAFITTPNESIIEAHIYSGIIIYIKSLRLSFDQIYGILSSGDIKEISFRKAEVKADIVQPQVITQTFPKAVSAFVTNLGTTPLIKLITVVNLLSVLTRVDEKEGMKAFDIMCRQLSTVYPEFLPEVSTLNKRMGRVADEFGIPAEFFRNKSLPANIYSAPTWVFSNLESLPTGSMKDVILYFIFFGNMFPKAIRTTVGKETSLGAKQGYATLSKAVHAELQNNSSASIFRGTEKLGDIKINWNTDKKSTALFTKADMDKLGLQNDEKVNLIFEE
jgi:hypothetical protein